ncbi:PKD domain-containing protein [Nocardioides carbamazepini]|uniref:PKD domain-containing protein n=1 Tax=Nocardioides carbamazepini TaxID=2854259 RepID=UPI00214A0185|nr:PKD domain-containing protein [Nocardioides carbamazepini]MCR1783696.1 PKD domain-containing protein [Nocardioides carbamazepini]
MIASRTLCSLLSVGALVGAVLAGAAPPPAQAADTGNPAPQTGRIVDDDPVGFTPHVMDGDVFTMARVGNTIVVGGTFTRVRSSGSSTDIARRNLFAFDAFTGQVSTTFAPNPNDRVYTLEPAADGTSVYVGGAFTSATSGGATVAVSRLYQASVATGARVAAFQPGTINGQVRDVSVTGNRLWVAGKFTHLQGQPSRALGTLNATTGARDPYYTAVIAGVHRGTVTNVQKIATDPANGKLVAIGNFDTVNGIRRHQFAVLDIAGGALALAPYYTTLFESACSASFETYMTDVEFSPSGSFFVVSTTGAYGGFAGSMAGTSGCDVVARFESGSTGTDVRPSWTAYTGGDTTWTVEVTDDVVYTGGHMRWQNNPARGDAADEGAVSRPGIAALSTRTGMPYSWNPTRTLGAGVRDMLATPEGLFVGSDTDVFAGETHRRVAFLPLASGTTLPPQQDGTLPGDVFRVASGGSQLVRGGFDGSVATPPVNAPNGTGWGTAVGAFMVNGDLYTAYANRTLTRRTFDGATYGAATTVNAADALVYQDDWHNGDIPTITSLFYDRGWIYFTKSGSSALYRRGFEPESGVIGQQLFSVPSVTGVSYSSMRGAFVAGGKLWFASSNGALSRADWAAHGAVSGTATTIYPSGSGWSSRALFLYQGPPVAPPVNQPPTATFAVSCAGLTCTFDAGGSSDTDGSVTGHAWAFGDGQTSTAGPTISHTYAAGGAVTVTLTVTDNGGATATTTRTAQPSQGAGGIIAVAADSTSGNRIAHRTTVPASVRPGDLLLAFFVANTTTPTYAGPAGWTEIETAIAGSKAVGRLYSRVATAADAGSPVTVTSSGYAKSVLTVVGYRGNDPATPVADSAVAVQTSSGAAHVTPAVLSPDGSHWLVSYWADKSGGTTSWTLPPGAVGRSSATGDGSGHVSSVLADSGGPLPAGPQGGLTATADTSGTAAITFSVLLAPS